MTSTTINSGSGVSEAVDLMAFLQTAGPLSDREGDDGEGDPFWLSFAVCCEVVRASEGERNCPSGKENCAKATFYCCQQNHLID